MNPEGLRTNQRGIVSAWAATSGWILLGALLLCPPAAQGAQLEGVSALDEDVIIVHVLNGQITRPEDGGLDTISRFDPGLDTAAATDTASWTITSAGDGNYAGGLNPQACHRKTKMNGQAEMDWSGNDYNYEYTTQHWIFLRLPHPMQQGATYTLSIDPGTNLGAGAELTFDIFHSRSPAVHTNVVGYMADAPHKAADLYFWMGDGGSRDYASFEGRQVHIYNVNTDASAPVGSVAHWMAGGSDLFNRDLTGSDVWSVDFSGHASPGTYRLAVEGVGCSDDFVVANDIYQLPFQVSVLGFFYMRIGQDALGISPPPRTPLYIPGVSPADTTVYLTSMHPYHPQWESFASGDKWDRRQEWEPFRLPAEPTNPEAWGGHSDAADWDRHLGHVSIIWDMLLPFILSGGAIDDDDLGISESGNGIPDLLDEAAFEVDMWLRLRDPDGGYSHGLNNPDGNNVLHQAGCTAISAWVNAANCAMLAEAFRLTGDNDSMTHYLDEAIAAYTHAAGLADQMLDAQLEVGYDTIRGRDLKMMAAAYLYNLTGEAGYEAVIAAESVCSGPTSALGDNETFNQIWATAAYLTTPQAVNHLALQADMKASVLYDARQQEANHIDSRPSRRATHNTPGYFRTSQNVHRTIIAHAVADDPADRDFFLKALALEADWGLGRNPLNMVQMTTASTALEGEYSAWYVYTSGRNDGFPGSHPGHTPYMNLDDWGSMVMARPSALYAHCYPDFASQWPVGEGYFDTPYSWAHSEFTPQQTMRGKMALYGYLYALSQSIAPRDPLLSVFLAGTGGGTVASTPGGIDCPDQCGAEFPAGTSVTLEATPDGSSVFAGWDGGGCSGTGSCTVSLAAPVVITARFDEACQVDADCDDGDECTTDACDQASHTCTHTPLPDCGADCSNGETRSCYDGPNGTQDVGVCRGGEQACVDQAWSDCAGMVLPGDELCDDALDNNCDGRVDEDCGQVDDPLLGVEMDGAGGGQVHSVPEGIDCGDTCSARFASGTQVTLVASPDPDSRFEGWRGGGCYENGTCTLTLSAQTVVTATFSLRTCQQDADCDDGDECTSDRCDSDSQTCVNDPIPDCGTPNCGDEICSDGLDNDCDGRVDEGCRVSGGCHTAGSSPEVPMAVLLLGGLLLATRTRKRHR